MAPDPQADEVITHAELDETISRVANNTSFADRLAARGETTVVMDADGTMVVRHPDGRIERSAS